ncbi:5099_t:CDS:2, partial [Paraglomus occultum]
QETIPVKDKNQEIIGEELSGRADYGITDIEVLLCVAEGTNWYFILYTTEGIYCTSETEYHISLTKSALKDDLDLKNSVKKVMEIVAGLLKDRVMV